MVSYDWANGGSVGVIFRHGIVSGLWGELVLFQGMGMKLQGCCKVAGKGIVSMAPLKEFYVGQMMFQVNSI